MTERAIIEQATRLRRQREAHLVATIVRGGRVPDRLADAADAVPLDLELRERREPRRRAREHRLGAHAERRAVCCSAVPDGDLCSAFGLDGEGAVELLVERAGVPGRIDSLEIAEKCLRTQRRGAVVTVIGGGKVGARVAWSPARIRSARWTSPACAAR